MRIWYAPELTSQLMTRLHSSTMNSEPPEKPVLVNSPVALGPTDQAAGCSTPFVTASTETRYPCASVLRTLTTSAFGVLAIGDAEPSGEDDDGDADASPELAGDVEGAGAQATSAIASETEPSSLMVRLRLQDGMGLHGLGTRLEERDLEGRTGAPVNPLPALMRVDSSVFVCCAAADASCE